MPLSTCTVSGTIYAANGTPLANEPLTIRLRDWTAGSDGIVMPDLLTTTTNGSGDLSIALGQGIYTVETARPGVQGRRFFTMSVPSSATANLHAIADFSGVARQAEFLDGSVSSPAFRFVNDLDTGLFLKSANAIGVAAGGSEVASFASTGTSTLALLVGDGSATTPAIRFTADTNTGLWRLGNDAMGVATNGAEVARFTTSGVQITGLVTGTAVTQSNLDPTVGRLMKTGDFGLGTPAGIGQATVTLNTATTPGFYGYLSSDPNAPTANSGFVIVSRSFSLNVRQEAGPATSGVLFQRRSSDGGTNWTAWERIYTSVNVLGTVSQSGGVPTGAVIERGSNANGEFVRFADGTQICIKRLTLTAQNVNTAYGSLFRSDNIMSGNTLWAATFAAAPAVAITTHVEGLTSLTAVGGTGDTNNTPSTVYAVITLALTNRTIHLNAVGVGRWF